MTSLKSLKKLNNQSTKQFKPKSSQKVGLIGPFGGGNLGDAAIQQSAIANLRQYNPDLQICGFSINPQDTQLRHGIPSYPVNKIANAENYGWWRNKQNSKITYLISLLKKWQNSRNLLRKIGSKIITYLLEVLSWWRAYQNFQQLNLDWLVVSGGGQLDDYWGGAWGHPFTLLRWCVIAKLSGSKFLIVSTGAGPIEQPLSKVFTYITLSLADYRSYRDRESKQYIETVVKFKRNDPVYSDLAFSLPITDNRQVTTSTPNSIIGISPMSYFHPASWPEKDHQVYQQYLRGLADFAVWLAAENYTLALFPGQIKHDSRAIADLQVLLQQRGVPAEQIIIQPILTVDDLIQQLLATEIVVASRFHGVLLSLLVKQPVLALSYHPKIDSLMADTEQSEYCLNIDDLALEKMQNLFMNINHQRAKIVQQLARKTAAYQSALKQQYEYLFHNF